MQTPPREPSNQPENTLEQAEWKGARLAAEELWEKRQIQSKLRPGVDSGSFHDMEWN